MQANMYHTADGEKQVLGKYAELLRHWPIEKEELMVKTRHGETFVIASGNPNNPPLFLFHGMSVNSIMWINDIATFCKSHRVYVVDILGEPGRSEANRPSLKGPAYQEWIEDLYTELNVQQAALAGISFGAYLSLKFACANPEKVTRLCVLCPAGVASVRVGFIFELLLCHLFLGKLGRNIIFSHVLGKDEIDQRNKEFFRNIFRIFKPRSGGIPTISDKELTQLYCPIFLILGGKDVLFNSDKILLRLAKLVPQLEVLYRRNSGHMLSQCTREIDRFLLTQYAPD